MTTTKARECGSKKRHRTRGEAAQHRRELWNAGAALTALNVYRCPRCLKWHVGHAPHRKWSR